jgi:hypothetical protein
MRHGVVNDANAVQTGRNVSRFYAKSRLRDLQGDSVRLESIDEVAIGVLDVSNVEENSQHCCIVTSVFVFQGTKRSSVERQCIIELPLLVVDAPEVEEEDGFNTSGVMAQEERITKEVHSFIILGSLAEVLRA